MTQLLQWRQNIFLWKKSGSDPDSDAASRNGSREDLWKAGLHQAARPHSPALRRTCSEISLQAFPPWEKP